MYTVCTCPSDVCRYMSARRQHREAVCMADIHIIWMAANLHLEAGEPFLFVRLILTALGLGRPWLITRLAQDSSEPSVFFAFRFFIRIYADGVPRSSDTDEDLV